MLEAVPSVFVISRQLPPAHSTQTHCSNIYVKSNSVPQDQATVRSVGSHVLENLPPPPPQCHVLENLPRLALSVRHHHLSATHGVRRVCSLSEDISTSLQQQSNQRLVVGKHRHRERRPGSVRSQVHICRRPYQTPCDRHFRRGNTVQQPRPTVLRHSSQQRQD